MAKINVKAPQFECLPVIVIHLGTDDFEEGRCLAACSGHEFKVDSGNQYRDIPRVPCIGCLNVARKGL